MQSPTSPSQPPRISSPSASSSSTAPLPSILLNRNDPPHVDSKALKPKAGPAIIDSVKGAFSFNGGVGGGVHESAIAPRRSSALSNDSRKAASTNSVSSAGSSSSSSNGASNPLSQQVESPLQLPGQLNRSLSTSSRRSTSTSISFAPLPKPPKLERRKSITLGVAARSNMLRTQGSPAGGKRGTGGPDSGHFVMMTDEEWKAYQEQHRIAEAPPLHTLIKTGFKSLSKRARSMSNSSKGSDSSNPPAIDQANLARLESNASDVSLDRHAASTAQWVSTIPVPETAVEDETGSDIGSGQEEEDEDMEDVDDEVDRGGAMEGIQEENEGGESEEDESSPRGRPSDLPTYLQKDLSAERRHYAHLPPEHRPNTYRTSEIDTPIATPRRRNSGDESDFKAAHLSTRLEEMTLGHQRLARQLSESGTGDQTPRAPWE